MDWWIPTSCDNAFALTAFGPVIRTTMFCLNASEYRRPRTSLSFSRPQISTEERDNYADTGGYALCPRAEVALRLLAVHDDLAFVAEWQDFSTRAPSIEVVTARASELWSAAQDWHLEAHRSGQIIPLEGEPGRPSFVAFFACVQSAVALLVADQDISRELVFCPHGPLWSFPLGMVHFMERDYFGFRCPVISPSMPLEVHTSNREEPRCKAGTTYLWVDDSSDLSEIGRALRSLIGSDLCDRPEEAEAIIIVGHGEAGSLVPFEGPGQWSMHRLATEGRPIRAQLVMLISCFSGANVAQLGGEYEGMDTWLGALGACAVISTPARIPTWYGALMSALTWILWRHGATPRLAYGLWIQAVATDRRSLLQLNREGTPDQRRIIKEIWDTWDAQRAALGPRARYAWSLGRMLRTWGHS